MYYFINAFMEVDSTNQPHEGLKQCGNLFNDRASAISALQKIRLILKEYKNGD